MTPTRRRVGDLWQAWCCQCYHELGTFRPMPAGERVVCGKCGTEHMVVLTVFSYPVCYPVAEGPDLF